MYDIIQINHLVSFGFILSFLVCCTIVATKKFHIFISSDTLTGKQKFHNSEVPRVGGVALYLSGIVFAITQFDNKILTEIMVAVTPIFIAGLLEDLFKVISSWTRLIASLISAFVFVIIFGHVISETGFQIIDSVLDRISIWPIIAILIVATLVNSINIIDGFNGLASGVSIVALACLGVVAYRFGDDTLLATILLLLAIIFGFFVVNFPRGLLFLGDGGAYFCGFALSCIWLVLLERNLTIEPSILLVVLAYPLVELFFSIYRKVLRKGHRPDQPDSVHFHMLLYRKIKSTRIKHYLNPNAATGIILQLLPLSGMLFVLLFPQNKLYYGLYFVAFCGIYLRAYKKLSLNG